MKIVYFFYCLFLSLLPIFLVAQSKEKDEKNEKNLSIYALGTIQIPEFNNFNNILQANNYSVLPSTNVNIGGGVAFSKGDILIQAEIRSYKNEIKNTTSTGSLNVTLFQINVGYSLLNNDKFKISPLLGLGVSRANLGIYPTINNNTNLGGLLTNPAGFTQLSTSQLSLHLGVQAEAFPVYFNFTGGRKARTLVGLKAGYYLPFQEVTWRTGASNLIGSAGTPVTDKINMNFGGFYVSILAGIDLLKLK